MWHVKKIQLLLFCLLAVLSLIVLTMFLSWINPVVQHTVKQLDKYEIRNNLLMQTIGEMGVINNEDAVNLWAKGVKLRNGAMQAAVMDSNLQASYLISLDRVYPNWVTAFSSPWVASYEIEKVIGDPNRYKVQFVTETSSGYDDTYEARLTLKNEHGFPKIGGIDMEEGLKAYTGF